MTDLQTRVRAIMVHRRWPGSCWCVTLARHSEPFTDPALEHQALRYTCAVVTGLCTLDEVRAAEDRRAERKGEG